MRVLLLADTYSEHTEKWALGLSSQKIEIGLFSFNKASYSWYNNQPNITLLFEPQFQLEGLKGTQKISYLKHVKKLKEVIQIFKPDILHAHYATSYGLVGALAKFHPLVISAWGTDVMKFPQKSFVNKAILKYNLKKADAICATSYTIDGYLKPVTNKTVNVIPFGVDVDLFKRKTPEGSLFDSQTFVFGCVKSHEKLYNLDITITSFAKLAAKFPDKKMKLMLVGEGSETSKLKLLAEELKISNHVVFTGRVPFGQISNYYNMLDVLINISEYESFGVSVIEAMACEKAVIVTNTGGLKEIVENTLYGELVEVGNTEQTVAAMEKYLLNPELAEMAGTNGRQKVLAKYNWHDNILQMISVYKQLLITPKL